MKFVAISDTHGCHRQLHLPEGDVLLHAGDVCDKASVEEVEDFLLWFNELDFEYKIFVRGNHDIDLKTQTSLLEYKIPDGLIQLNYSGCSIDGILVWGIPFPFDHEDKPWENIPTDTQILITHQPPFSILDNSYELVPKGDRELLRQVKLIEPKVHLFGHIHASYGMRKVGETTFINASAYRTSLQRIVNEPVVFEL